MSEVTTRVTDRTAVVFVEGNRPATERWRLEWWGGFYRFDDDLPTEE